MENSGILIDNTFNTLDKHPLDQLYEIIFDINTNLEELTD